MFTVSQFGDDGALFDGYRVPKQINLELEFGRVFIKVTESILFQILFQTVLITLIQGIIIRGHFYLKWILK